MANRSDNQFRYISLTSVLVIPELAHLIYGFSDRQNYVAMIYLCRRAFACVAPIIWKDVDLKSVLLLIPGVDVVQTLKAEEPMNTFNFPTTLDLSRLEIYKSYVRVLRAPIPYVINFPSEWPNPGTQAASTSLLPDLRSLIVNTFYPIETEFVAWIPKVLTPNLRELEMRAICLEQSAGEDQNEEHWWMSWGACLELVERLYQTCPDIEKLQIFPRGPRDNQPDNRIVIYNKLTSLEHLDSLMLGESNAGQDLFQTLGELQNLKRLSIMTDWSEVPPNGGDPITLPNNNSFPALRHLMLSGVDECIVQRISDSPQLFHRLISASIIYEDQSIVDSTMLHSRSLSVMNCFSHQSTALTDLTVLTHGADSYFSMFPSFIDVFKRMPLRRLRLGGIDLAPDEGEPADSDEEHSEPRPRADNPPLKWEDFLAAVPHLEELRLENQLFELHDLGLFASALPKLRLLVLQCIESDEELWRHRMISEPVAATQDIVIRCGIYIDRPLSSELFANDVSRYTNIVRQTLFADACKLGIPIVFGRTLLLKQPRIGVTTGHGPATFGLRIVGMRPLVY
ncbi:hypothetical protein FRC07_009359 [Ceratobasidium sp. 392]|nr:hypothetical protein FRC07_009359 [Ceratobasidium sp. 392]